VSAGTGTWGPARELALDAVATGDTLKVANPDNRALILNLLERARQNGSELYAAGGPPFHLKVSFTSNGQSRYSGAGEMEEIRCEFRGLRKDGSAFPVEVHGRRIEHGGKTGVMGTLVDNTELFYQISVTYQAEHARGVRWNDPIFGIEWPISNPIISARDSAYADHRP